MMTPSALVNTGSWIADHAWLVELAIFLALIFLFNFLLKRSLKSFKQRSHLKEADWRAHLDYVFIEPVRILLWILFAALLFDLIAQKFELQETFPSLSPLRDAAVIGCLAWFLLRWKRVFLQAMIAKKVQNQSMLEPHSLQIMGKIFTIATLFVALLIILQIFGLNVLPLIAFGSIGAAAIGFASRDVIANFFGGLMIHLTRPFAIHDLIELPQKKIVGHIEEIGWYFTSVRDLEKKAIYVPNAIFSNEVVVNQSRITHQRIEEKIRIRLSDANAALRIVEEIRHLLAARPDIDAKEPIHVFVSSFAPSSIELEVKAYTQRIRYEEFRQIQQEILLQIEQLIRRAGAEIPIPATEVVLRK
jgi:MscS family membrane protein